MADIARAGVEARARGGNAGRAGWAWRHARNAPAPPARPTARAHVERTHRAAQPPALHQHSSSFSYWVRHPDTQTAQLPHLPAPTVQTALRPNVLGNLYTQGGRCWRKHYGINLVIRNALAPATSLPADKRLGHYGHVLMTTATG